MSEQLMSEATEVLGPNSAGTQKVADLLCEFCGVKPVPVSKFKPRKFCSRECSHGATEHRKRSVDNAFNALMRRVARNIRYEYLNRDRYVDTYGQQSGPLNKAITVVKNRKKDRGYCPMPIDCHIEPSSPRFTQVSPEDVKHAKRNPQDANWCRAQGKNGVSRGGGSLVPGGTLTAFCADCVDMVFDGEEQVRYTRGVYTTAEHKHPHQVRAYDLHNNLLGVVDFEKET